MCRRRNTDYKTHSHYYHNFYQDHLCQLVPTHIDLHSLDREGLDGGHLVGHEPVELVPALVPLHRVQGVPTEVVAAGEVRGLTLLQVFGDAN